MYGGLPNDLAKLRRVKKHRQIDNLTFFFIKYQRWQYSKTLIVYILGTKRIGPSYINGHLSGVY